MVNANSIDIALSQTGDLVLDGTGDIATVDGIQVLQQDILFRLLTRQGDYLYEPQCGTTLDSLIGMPNSPATAAQGEATIVSALTHDGYIPTGYVTVYSYPITDNQIVFSILIDLRPFNFGTQQSISIEITLDLLEGLIF